MNKNNFNLHNNNNKSNGKNYLKISNKKLQKNNNIKKK